MTEPQVWVLIGVFAAAMTGMITMVLVTMRAMLDRMRHEIAATTTESRAEMRAEMTELRAEMREGFAAIQSEMRVMQGDVGALYRHAFGEPPSHGPGRS